jgi:hypothetical protein
MWLAATHRILRAELARAIPLLLDAVHQPVEKMSAAGDLPVLVVVLGFSRERVAGGKT